MEKIILTKLLLISVLVSLASSATVTLNSTENNAYPRRITLNCKYNFNATNNETFTSLQLQKANDIFYSYNTSNKNSPMIKNVSGVVDLVKVSQDVVSFKFNGSSSVGKYKCSVGYRTPKANATLPSNEVGISDISYVYLTIGANNEQGKFKIGDNVAAVCNYHMANGGLTTMQFTKNKQVFYSYSTDKNQNFTKITGIDKISNSTVTDGRSVTILNANSNASGNYTCQVNYKTPDGGTTSMNSKQQSLNLKSNSNQSVISIGLMFLSILTIVINFYN